MKVSFETIIPDENSSFRVLHVNVPTSELNWEYHYHPEIELVGVVSGNGTRHVGYHKSNFTDGDLVLIGSNIPHSGFGLNCSDPHEEIVLQFREEILNFPNRVIELNPIVKMLELAKFGILFSNKTKKKMLPKLAHLLKISGHQRLILIIEILFELSETKDYQLLNNEVMPFSIISKNKTRLQTIFTFVEKNYQQEILIDQVAALCNLTLPAFCNFFKKATKITFTEFVNRYRIEKACLLISQDQTISEACYKSGFNNVTYFNRIFKKYTKKTPTEFKKIL